MILRLLSRINKSVISYLLIILAFALLVLFVYLFFKFKIKALEKESKYGYQATNKINIEKPGVVKYEKLNADVKD